MLEHLQQRLAVAIEPRELQDPLFGHPQLLIAPLQKTDAAFVLGEALFEVGGAVFETAEDSFRGRPGLSRTSGNLKVEGVIQRSPARNHHP